MSHIVVRAAASLAIVAGLLVSSPAYAADLPAIKDKQLIVDGKPFLAIGGELHNSSASSPSYMKPIWDKLQAMHVRTVIGTAAWDDVEPSEGVFNFDAVDAQIAEARARDMRLVLIWFGAYKNAASTYAPGWVRSDAKRFPRAVIKPGSKEQFSYEGAMPKPVLSVFSPQLVAADRKAFTAFMAHLAKVDTDHRVIMVQVENEVGLLRDSRDRSAGADAAWKTPVPAALTSYLAKNRSQLKPELEALWKRQGYRKSGTWAEVFGDDWQAEEVFMAWHFARYVETLAAAGKAQLALPMYANAWLGPQPGAPTAGLYPSGGPTVRVLDIWMAAAPTLDLLAPDIYVSDAKAVYADYDHRGNPSFTPEARFRAGNLFWALGEHAALGFAVFGVEDGRPGNQISQAYQVLNPMSEVIAKAQADGRIAGVLLESGETATIRMGDYSITVRDPQAVFKQLMLDAGLQAPPAPPAPPSETDGAIPWPADTRPFGLIIDEGKDTFLLVGKGFTADFSRDAKLVEVDRVEEGRFEAGVWRPGRALNGDERLIIVPADRIGAVRIRLLRPR